MTSMLKWMFVVWLVMPMMVQASNIFDHHGQCLTCREGMTDTPVLKMYDLAKADFTKPQTVAINLPYDVDTAFAMARDAWGLRDREQLVAEGGQRWMYRKAKEGSWIYVAKPGQEYIARDENTWYSADGTSYTFYVSVIVKKTSPVTSRLVLRYRGLGEQLDSLALLQDLMGVAYGVNVGGLRLADTD